jgi:hypothetical protein
MDAKTIERLLGVTPETLTTYVMRPMYQIGAELVAKGW